MYSLSLQIFMQQIQWLYFGSNLGCSVSRSRMEKASDFGPSWKQVGNNVATQTFQKSILWHNFVQETENPTTASSCFGYILSEKSCYLL